MLEKAPQGAFFVWKGQWMARAKRLAPESKALTTGNKEM